jgi:hypothetical protein
MAKITNFHAGPRGINMKDGTTVWVEPGQTVDIDKGKVNGDMPDMGSEADLKKAAAANADDLAAANARIAELETQVDEQAKQIAELTKPAA